MFGHDEETGVENENWSSLSAAMLTLFTYVTVRITFSNYYNRACLYNEILWNLIVSKLFQWGPLFIGTVNWFLLQGIVQPSNFFQLLQVDGWTDIQSNLETRPYSQWFTISFIFLGHFIFTNLFIGIIIMVRRVLCSL
jgi:hypothetical protein